MTASTESLPADDFAAFVGLDWADQKHDLAIREAGSQRTEQRVLPHTPEAIEEWAGDLRRRFDGRQVAICFEQTRGPIAYALLKYDFIVLFPLPPAQLSSYRKAFRTSCAKDDPTDAALLLDFLLHHREQLRAWRPDSPQTRELRLLAEHRRTAVDDKTALSNRLTAALKSYFPQALTLVGRDVDTLMACAFLGKWSTLQAAQRAAPATLRKFYYGQQCRSEKRIQERLELLRNAIPLTDDAALIAAGELLVKCLIAQIRTLHRAIEKFERRIDQLMEQHADARLFRALPGAGKALAPRLLTAFGDDRERFEKAHEMQCLSGAAPVTKRSGKRTTVHRRWACPTFLLQTFHEFAHCSRFQSAWAAAFYTQQRDAGKGHNAAIRSLAFKWIRVIFRCWKTNTCYDEQRYLNALQKRNAPLLAFLPDSQTARA